MTALSDTSYKHSCALNLNKAHADPRTGEFWLINKSGKRGQELILNFFHVVFSHFFWEVETHHTLITALKLGNTLDQSAIRHGALHKNNSHQHLHTVQREQFRDSTTLACPWAVGGNPLGHVRQTMLFTATPIIQAVAACAHPAPLCTLIHFRQRA